MENACYQESMGDFSQSNVFRNNYCIKCNTYYSILNGINPQFQSLKSNSLRIIGNGSNISLRNHNWIDVATLIDLFTFLLILLKGCSLKSKATFWTLNYMYLWLCNLGFHLFLVTLTILVFLWKTRKTFFFGSTPHQICSPLMMHTALFIYLLNRKIGNNKFGTW